MRTSLHRIRGGAIVLVTVFVVAVCGYRFFGDHDWIDAVWMVVVTISTVGYAEQSTQSSAMQLFTVAVILIGMSASVYTVGGLIQIMLEGELQRIAGKRRMDQELAKLSGHIIVCGFGRMGQQLADELHNQHRSVAVIEKNPAIQDDAIDHGFLVLIGDATEEETLLEAGVDRAMFLVTGLPSDAENVFITLTARNLNPELKIISRAEQKSTEKKLLQAGATQVVMPTVVGARQMVRMITHPTTADLMERVSETSFEDLELDEIEIATSSRLSGLTVAETESWRRHRLLVVAIRRCNGQYVFNPSGNESLEIGDIVVVIGNGKDIRGFRQEYL